MAQHNPDLVDGHPSLQGMSGHALPEQMRVEPKSAGLAYPAQHPGDGVRVQPRLVRIAFFPGILIKGPD